MLQNESLLKLSSLESIEIALQMSQIQFNSTKELLGIYWELHMALGGADGIF